MLRRFSYLSAFALIFAAPAQSQEAEIRAFGEGLCQQVVLEGVEGIDSYYAETAEANGIDFLDYCSCVGQAFVDNAAHQMTLMADFADTDREAETMQSIIEANLSACLPLAEDDEGEIALSPFDPDYDLSEDIPPEEDEVLDGDLVDQDAPEGDFGGLGYDPQDALFCVQVIDGDFPARGFNSDAVKQRIQRQKLNVSEICTCTALWMVEQGEPLQDAIANAASPGNEWGTALGRGIMACLGE